MHFTKLTDLFQTFHLLIARVILFAAGNDKVCDVSYPVAICRLSTSGEQGLLYKKLTAHGMCHHSERYNHTIF